MKAARIAGLLLILFSFCFLIGCQMPDKLEFKTPYQVVFLDNTNAYIGQIQQTGKDFVQLANVYYIQSQVDPETKKTTNALIKRGNELHKPDLMFINRQHIVMIEPVATDSQVAKLIEQAEGQKTK